MDTGNASESHTAPGDEYCIQFDPSERTTPSVAVVEALARARNVNPTELDVQLSSVIDPDAIDALYRHGGETETGTDPWHLEFTAEGFEVTVRGDGRITVRNPHSR